MGELNGSSKRCLIRGYYGLDNLGDEVILQSILEHLNRLGVKGVIASAGNKYEADCVQGTVIEAGSFYTVRLLRHIVSSDFFILGGGGLFASDKPLKLNFILVFWAFLVRTPVFIFGVGVNPVRHRVTSMFWRLIAKKAKLITVRDELSFKVVKAFSDGEDNIKLLADLAFSLPGASKIFELGPTTTFDQYLLVNLAMPWSNEDAFEAESVGRRYELFVSQVSDLVKSLAYKGLKPVFLPFFEKGGDVRLAEDVVRRLPKELRAVVLPASLGVEEKLSYFSGASFCLNMRFHSIVFSAMSKTPCFTICYDHKSESLLDTLGLGDFKVRYGISKDKCFKEEADLPANVVQQALAAYEQSGVIQARMCARLPELESRSEDNYRLLNAAI